MTAKYLQQPVLDGGIRSVNFFNGRLLTGKDLSREQTARRQADGRVAQAVGDGVAYGLEAAVSKDSTDTAPTVSIQAGLALNRKGQVLYLQDPTDVLLGRRATPRLGAPRTFEECQQLKAGAYAARPGIYLLTLAPAEDTEGKALTHALDDASVPCNTDTVVEAVQFRLVPIDPLFSPEELADGDRLRNLIAYKCFGVETLRSVQADPLGTSADTYGLIDQLRGKGLTDCDVPLAVVSLLRGIDFIDLWSVRRRTTRRSASGSWSMVVDDRRRAEGEAMFLQFQEQVAALTRSDRDVRKITATKTFAYLPAAGILPMPGTKDQDTRAIATFFEGLTVRGPAFIEGARLEPLIRHSFAYPPMDLKSGELIWLYWVRENREAIDYNTATPPQAYLVFASGHIPYQADARFNLAKWSYSNYALE